MKAIPVFITLALVGLGCKRQVVIKPPFSSFSQAETHSIFSDKPAVNFFEGAVLGNGGLGAIVTTRPDAIVIYFGHNDVWDIRVAEKHREELLDFQTVFEKVKKIPDTLSDLSNNPWYRKYAEMAAENYEAPYPRPFPCGSVLLGFDRRKFELIGHRLDISNGLCQVFLLDSLKRKVSVQIFTPHQKDELWIRTVDSMGQPINNVFRRIRVIPDPSRPEGLPAFQGQEVLYQGILSFRQVLPFCEPEKINPKKGNPGDKAFRLLAKINGPLFKESRINWYGNQQGMAFLEAAFESQKPLIACISLEQGMDNVVSREIHPGERPVEEGFVSALTMSTRYWKAFWEKSGVVLADTFLEELWYRNLYFFNCAVSEDANTPGLFANWSYNTIGTAWHSDYHMNYNTEQPFWVTFSTNHCEKNFSYIKLVENLMDVSLEWAKNYYHLPGACFPHSAYPVKMTMNPYPVPDWGWEICETPWTVQGLWWQYQYTMDRDYLRSRAYAPIRAAVQFISAYMMRPEARGDQWQDTLCHIFPTVPPELYGLQPGFRYNYDCTVDLTLVKFVFKAFLESTRILAMEEEEKPLIDSVKYILSRFPAYPTASSGKYGRVMVSVPGENDQVVYNTPNPLMPVFPGEDIGLGSDSLVLALARNTFINQQNEGGNDLVFLNLQAARIGMLDVERFKRQVKYCLLPNGTATDRVMQVNGRYSDDTPYGYMDHMGIWFENFALPAVVDECLLQGYDGTIRLFPNWPLDKDAEFHQLRTAGAFLVSARLENGKVKWVEINSEAGGLLKIMLPWKKGTEYFFAGKKRMSEGGLMRIKTRKGELIRLQE